MSKEIHLLAGRLNVPFIHVMSCHRFAFSPQTLPISQKPRTWVCPLVRRASWAVKPLPCPLLSSSGSGKTPGTVRMETGLPEQSWWSASYMGGEGCSKGGTKMSYCLLYNRGSFRTRNKDKKIKNKWIKKRKLGNGQYELISKSEASCTHGSLR